MFDLEKHERIIVIFLLSALMLGLAVMAYKRSHSGVRVELGRFSAPGPVSDNTAPSTHAVNINTASADELDELKGIGKALAVRIVEYRTSQGLFLSKEDIKKVKGIGQALFDKIKDRIVTE